MLQAEISFEIYSSRMHPVELVALAGEDGLQPFSSMQNALFECELALLLQRLQLCISFQAWFACSRVLPQNAHVSVWIGISSPTLLAQKANEVCPYSRLLCSFATLDLRAVGFVFGLRQELVLLGRVRNTRRF